MKSRDTIDDRLIFRQPPAWFGFAAPGGTSNVAADRCIREVYLDQPRLFFENVVYPQLDYLDGNGRPLALVLSNVYGYENTERVMDFDAAIEAEENPRLERWCDELPGHLADLAATTECLVIYVGSPANDPDMIHARATRRREYANRFRESLAPIAPFADHFAFDQVCQLTAGDPVYQDMLRTRQRLGRPCFAESRPTEETRQWIRDAWGFMFRESHLLLRGEQWVPLDEIRRLGSPIVRMTGGVPKSVDPETGKAWDPWKWASLAARNARSVGDSVAMNLREPASLGMRLEDFE